MIQIVMNVPADFVGIEEAMVIPVMRSLITNIGVNLPGSSSLPKNAKSKCTRPEVPSVKKTIFF